MSKLTDYCWWTHIQSERQKMTVIPKVKRQCKICQAWVETTARNLYLCDGCRIEANKMRARCKAIARYHRHKALREVEMAAK
jgi:hypothetical protein